MTIKGRGIHRSEKRNAYKNMKGRDNSKDLGVEGKTIIIKSILSIIKWYGMD
jgi:hypothetical protein